MTELALRQWRNRFKALAVPDGQPPQVSKLRQEINILKRIKVRKEQVVQFRIPFDQCEVKVTDIVCSSTTQTLELFELRHVSE